jgi:hypothetical protein
MVSPIIMSYRKNDTSVLLKQLIKLVREFDKWDASAGQPSSRTGQFGWASKRPSSRAVT